MYSGQDSKNRSASLLTVRGDGYLLNMSIYLAGGGAGDSTRRAGDSTRRAGTLRGGRGTLLLTVWIFNWKYGVARWNIIMQIYGEKSRQTKIQRKKRGINRLNKR